MKRLTFTAQRVPLSAAIELFMAQRSGKKVSLAETVVMRELAEGEVARPFMTMDVTEAQTLMDELWHCGLRPSEGTGSAGSLAATERHLADMRKLVFEGRPA
jgi:hypothetical protein